MKKKRSSLIWSAVWFALSACEFTLLTVGTVKKAFSTLTTVLTAINASLTLTLGILHLCDYLGADPDEEPDPDGADSGREANPDDDGTLEIVVE